MRIGDFSIVGQSEAIIGRASPYQGLSPDHNHLWGLVSPTPRPNHHKNLWDQSYNHFKNRSFNERFYPDAFHFFSFPQELNSRQVSSWDLVASMVPLKFFGGPWRSRSGTISWTESEHRCYGPYGDIVLWSLYRKRMPSFTLQFWLFF